MFGRGRIQSRGADKREFGEQVRFRAANVRGRRGDLPFCLPNIRATLEQLQRQTHWDFSAVPSAANSFSPIPPPTRLAPARAKWKVHESIAAHRIPAAESSPKLSRPASGLAPRPDRWRVRFFVSIVSGSKRPFAPRNFPGQSSAVPAFREIPDNFARLPPATSPPGCVALQRDGVFRLKRQLPPSQRHDHKGAERRAGDDTIAPCAVSAPHCQTTAVESGKSRPPDAHVERIHQRRARPETSRTRNGPVHQNLQ